ncbi:MAG: Holliday junction resolvase RuvX [Puniceicoccales bacterium]|jgi:putative Holliday junction resolvase|nr:Holliday junction resolvase RuvX [Puniceicoccales bacterium]
MPDYLGIDYGTKKVGLSWGDDTLGMAVPINPIVGFGTLRELIRRLAGVIEKKNPSALVLGYPLHMDGTEGRRVREVKAFAKTLRTHFNRPIYPMDERLTTFEARGNPLKNKRPSPSGRHDSLAATYILQDFLDQRQKGDGFDNFPL